MKDLRISVGVWYLGATSDRFVKEGYRADRTMEERFQLAASIDGVGGLEMHYPTEVTDETYKPLKGLANDVADGSEHVPAFKVDTVDATGCGDAFIAGLLCQLVVGVEWRAQLSVERMREALCYGNAVGALTSLTQGVIPALPTAAAVDAFLAER